MLQAQWNLLNKLHICHCRSVLWVPEGIISSLYNQIFVLAGKWAPKTCQSLGSFSGQLGVLHGAHHGEHFETMSGTGLQSLCHLSLHLLWETMTWPLSQQADEKGEESSKAGSQRVPNVSTGRFLCIWPQIVVSYSNILITLRDLQTKHFHSWNVFSSYSAHTHMCSALKSLKTSSKNNKTFSFLLRSPFG